MDRKTVLDSALFVSLLAPFAIFAGTGRAAADAPRPVQAGKVVAVAGRVLIRQDSGSGAATPLKPGDVVREGDVLNTSSDGKAKLLLEDKTILDLGPSALFKVQKFDAKNGGDRQVDIAMAYGSVRASVSRPLQAGGKFQIRTKSATMGVRGTEFIVNTAMPALTREEKSQSDGKPQPASASATTVTVVQGKVEVAPAAAPAAPASSGRQPSTEAKKSAPVMLTAGTQLVTSTAAGAPAPKAVALSATQLTAVSASAQVQDNTFTQAVTLGPSSEGGGNGGGSAGAGGATSTAAGQATRDALAQAISVTPPPMITSPNAGFVGTFAPAGAPMQSPAFIPAGGFRTVRIVVTQ